MVTLGTVAAGAGARDDRGPGRRRHHRLLARRGERARAGTTRLQLPRRLLGHVREPVRGHRARRREGRRGAASRRDGQAGLVRARRPEESQIELADGFARVKDGPEEAALPFMALGAIVNANNAFLPPDFNPTLNRRYVYRPHFGVVDTEKKMGKLTLTYATQIHACVVEVDPETGEVRDRRLRAPSTTAARAINPQIVEGQVHGAAAHAIGAAIHERLRLRRGRNAADAELLRLPRAPRARPAAAKTAAIESPSPFTPLGAKGMGEGGGGGIHCICCGDPGCAPPRPASRSSTTAPTRTTASGTCCETPRRHGPTWRWSRDEGRRNEGAVRRRARSSGT